MKRHGNLWDAVTHPDNIAEAYRRAKKGKSWQRHVKDFELDVPGNLLRIQKLLCTGVYSTSSYRTKTVYEPKKRDIYVLPFYPDRVVQHALLQILVPIWDALMIPDSYACRTGRGMHDASRKTMQYVRKYRYCFKADISKFYPSVNHTILLHVLERKIKCKRTLTLLENIVRSYPGESNVPIGNYTSQWFGNLYMNELDQWLLHTHKVKAYVRYCDDFVVFSNDKAELQKLQQLVKAFLKEHLKLQFSKWSVFPVTQGVDFVGYRHFPNKVLLRTSTARRAKKRMQTLLPRFSRGELTLDQCRSSIASTEGWIKWACTYNLRAALQLRELKGQLECMVSLNT